MAALLPAFGLVHKACTGLGTLKRLHTKKTQVSERLTPLLTALEGLKIPYAIATRYRKRHATSAIVESPMYLFECLMRQVEVLLGTFPTSDDGDIVLTEDYLTSFIKAPGREEALDLLIKQLELTQQALQLAFTTITVSGLPPWQAIPYAWSDMAYHWADRLVSDYEMGRVQSMAIAEGRLFTCVNQSKKDIWVESTRRCQFILSVDGSVTEPTREVPYLLEIIAVTDHTTDAPQEEDSNGEEDAPQPPSSSADAKNKAQSPPLAERDATHVPNLSSKLLHAVPLHLPDSLSITRAAARSVKPALDELPSGVCEDGDEVMKGLPTTDLHPLDVCYDMTVSATAARGQSRLPRRLLLIYEGTFVPLEVFELLVLMAADCQVRDSQKVLVDAWRRVGQPDDVSALASAVSTSLTIGGA
ncbi:unnamed protein product [Vitrella brassicaformis CCMP3155]|uniref:Uncharacterized protein n=2 Tax=Vitrella brassicaformis TaxID=1169539 RepID=A0A0G4EVX4_VITBC|nr:unnamed protein product [Vitrella brassicaformis CCMP3155]|mmetsp:Transcript_47300/g.118102  ORF Transcript_47300/g.118102 Transcript_47300/m.118102 type:complete len:416 (+) Transcript_47300:192-1439(+)|eukprot:CEM02582.1 unnamed protein product [Vitrella brassicaformis CCMP3155]